MSNPSAEKVIHTVQQLFEQTREQGYAYCSGYWETTVMSLIFNYVPVMNREGLVKDLEKRIASLQEIKGS
jgi:DNA-binding IclR family transcriptional regulator